jgi:RNA polymerase sigma-70 factor (ECF subfamily)
MVGKTEVSDEQLMERVRAGDAPALEVLYDRYVRQCFGLALRLLGRDIPLAEEAVQDVFMKIWSRPDAYSAQKGKFASWLLSLVHHRCIDELRKRSRTEVPLDFEESGSRLDTEPDLQADPGDQVWMLEEQREILAALNEIAPTQREVIELAYFRGLSQSQIAARLKQPLGTVKTRVRMGLQNLRTLLEKRGLVRD